MSVADVRRIGAAALRVATEPQLPRPAKIRIPLRVRPRADGSARLVHAKTGELFAPCATVAVAEQLKAFFQ